jgi:hypothetical protein
MIIGIHGYLGSMKTTTATILAELAKESGYTILSNQPLSFPYIKLDMDMLRVYAILGRDLPWPKVFIFGDEWQQVMDARRSMDGDELINTYMIAQTRKRGIKLCYITSLRGMNDLRLRDNTNIIFKCYKCHKTVDPMTGSVHKGNICYDDECEKPHCADWYIINVAAGRGVHRTLYNPEIAFKLFDTKYIISPIAHLNEQDIAAIKAQLIGRVEEYEANLGMNPLV